MSKKFMDGVDVPVESVTDPEQATAKAIIGLMDIPAASLPHLTDINDDYELKVLTILGIIAKHYNIALLKDFRNEILRLKVSNKRKGREEIQKSVMSMINRASDNHMGFLQKIKNMV